jgi:hypothetical protein
MKRTLAGILTVLALVGPSACGSSSPTSPNGTVIVTGDIARGTGTVQFFTFEGGFFAIRGDDGKVYDPRNLAPAFQRDQLRVRFEARILRDVGGTHQVGQIVDVISIAEN